ncbi:hypothetical protein [Acidimangrovimonas pyrenivorans]|uniref:DUF305 domain-containing protein n=1 Tax=Acidimangrovimonas pyrenivorans TaxID=2030798 RepID=A0ABV7ALL7_9RHOB
MKKTAAIAVLCLGLAGPALADQAQTTGGHAMMQHGQHMAQGMTMTHSGSMAGTMDRMPPGVTQGGQAAFAAIQEIVGVLLADPETDWSRVNIEALRQHLIDMDNVTMRARVAAQPIDGGVRFTVTSDDPAVAGSIQRMTLAHAGVMDGVRGWHLVAEKRDGGAVLTATGAGDAAQVIRGLGYIGLMTVGMHHQAHHLALATGRNPHGN